MPAQSPHVRPGGPPRSHTTPPAATRRTDDRPSDPPDLRRCATDTMQCVVTPTEVSDPTDPRLDDYRDLTTADRRPDRPGGRGLVIAEGVVVVRRLIESPYPVRSLLGVPRRIEELTADLAHLDVPAYATDADTMATTVGFHLNRGVLAVADRAAPVDARELARTARVLAVCEGVNDHENLGSLFRNAAALGVDGILLGPRCAD